MNTHERAEKLYIEAEKLGMDAPSENMIAEALECVEFNTYMAIEATLRQSGLIVAADAVERWSKRLNAGMEDI